MSYDPSKWYSYSKNRPNVEDEIPCKKFDYIKNLERETNSKDEILSEEGPSKIEESKIDPGPSPLSAENVGTERNLETMKIPGVNVEQLETRKLNDFVKRLQKMTRELPSAYKKRLTYDVLTQLAQSLVDDTVFEIVKGLEDIQQISERSLLQKRMKILSEHKVQRTEMTKRHQSALLDCQSRPHQRKVIEKEHLEEKKSIEDKLEKELNQLDQKLVLEIDQQVIDQQATLQRAGVPLFSITNKPEDVQLQMYLLDFISRLIPDS